ncbi:MAG: rod shape-determining protein RodA [Planctomycetes bacterium]|nr:rod shape-determining protein RodA [Planctomycetota bacterium]
MKLLAHIDWWLVLLTAALAMVGVAFVHSGTAVDARFSDQVSRQLLFYCVAGVLAILLVAVPYVRIMRSAWIWYGVAVVALAGLPWFGVMINGSRRWYRVFGFGLQPSEFAKIAVIIVLAAWLRFRAKARTIDGLLVPMLITAVPVGLILEQPDLGSSLVFWPVLIAMCYAAGTPARTLAIVVLLGAVVLVLAYTTVLHDYQKMRVDVWLSHFGWDRATVETPEVVRTLRAEGYQPWQSLIGIGAGGLTGFGFMQGPQSQFDFLPYRSGDYIFAVVCEESGWLGAVAVLALEVLLVAAIARVALRCRERFGRLLAVGVATYLGTQALLHIAVCAWLVPATGLPMPFISYGGSSVVSSVMAVALAINVGARREPVLAADGYA